VKGACATTQKKEKKKKGALFDHKLLHQLCVTQAIISVMSGLLEHFITKKRDR